MTRLGDLAQGRDNNFNLIRMIAALAVLVSHAYPISLGPGAEEPLEALTGQSLGGLAVTVFFVISGFLIANSFARASHWSRFLLARVLRLWPALLVSLAVVALVMGPMVSTRDPAGYFMGPDVWSFLGKNSLLYDPQYTLPGVFDANPYKTVEGSIWTLFYEVACYMGIFVAGISGVLSRRGLASVLLGLFLVAWVAIAVVAPPLPVKASNMLHLALPFAVGTAFWLWRDHLPVGIAGVVVLAVVAWALSSTPLYLPALTLALAYATFWAAYVPGGIIRAYNLMGDYSYGVYIYAFPAQGLAIWAFGTLSPVENMLIALPITLVPAILSWHFLEKPALALRHRPILSPSRAT